MYQKDRLDFKPFGQAVRKAREEKGWTRDHLAEVLDLSVRYLMYIETRGSHPSLQKLYEIATLFNISVDQFFYTESTISKTTQNRQIENMMGELDESDLSIVWATIKAIVDAKEFRK